MLLTIASCSSKPTYRKEHLVESIQEILNESQIEATVRLVDHTLAIQFEYPEALVQTAGNVGVGPGLQEASRKVITAIHRVLLSSDADVQFYLLLVSDPKIPGVYLTMIRYVEDIRKLNVSIIGVSEMMSRTFWRFQAVNAGPLTLDQYLSREILLSDFLTWQLTQRIQEELTDALQSSGLASVGRCGGEFTDGEFLFVLNVVPTSNQPLDTDTMQLTFDTATDIIGKVLSAYDFESFETIRLVHPPTGQHFVMERAQLDLLH